MNHPPSRWKWKHGSRQWNKNTLPGLQIQPASDSHLLSSAEKKRFFIKQAFFEEGEKTGRLLARIATPTNALLQ